MWYIVKRTIVETIDVHKNDLLSIENNIETWENLIALKFLPTHSIDQLDECFVMITKEIIMMVITATAAGQYGGQHVE